MRPPVVFFACCALLASCGLLHCAEAAKARHFKWEVSNMFWSPDCEEKVLIGINGQFPGPTIRAKAGDTIVVELNNGLHTEGVVIHWHGIRQIGTPWADGTTTISQYAINPEETFTYRFVVDKPGTYFYHGHYGMQRAAGLYGSLIVDVADGAKAARHFKWEIMVGAGARSVAGQIMSIMFNIATVVLCIIQTFIDSTPSEIVHNFSLLDNSISCSKLLFVTMYHAVRTEGPQTLAFECLWVSSCVTFYSTTFHLNRSYKTWATTRIVRTVTLLALGVGLLCYRMLIPISHAWHTVAVPSIICSLEWLDVVLLICTQIKEDGGSQHLLCDLLMKLGETTISIYRCVDLLQNPDRHWNAQKILLLLGSGPPMLIGTCQILWLGYKADIIPKVAEWVRKIPRVFARKTEQAAGATMGSNGGRDVEDQVANERVEEGNGLPVTIGASQIGWIAYTAGIKFKVIKWFTKTSGVSATEDEHVAAVAMENYGGGESEQQAADEDVQVVVVSPA